MSRVIAPKLDPLVLQNLMEIDQLDLVDAPIQVLGGREREGPRNETTGLKNQHLLLSFGVANGRRRNLSIAPEAERGR